MHFLLYMSRGPVTRPSYYQHSAGTGQQSEWTRVEPIDMALVDSRFYKPHRFVVTASQNSQAVSKIIDEMASMGYDFQQVVMMCMPYFMDAFGSRHAVPSAKEVTQLVYRVLKEERGAMVDFRNRGRDRALLDEENQDARSVLEQGRNYRGTVLRGEGVPGGGTVGDEMARLSEEEFQSNEQWAAAQPESRFNVRHKK